MHLICNSFFGELNLPQNNPGHKDDKPKTDPIISLFNLAG